MPPIICYLRSAGRPAWLCPLALLAWLAATPLQAQDRPLQTPLSSGDKIKITADDLEANLAERRFVFRGRVKVVQEATTVDSDVLIVHLRPDTATPPSNPATNDDRIEKIEAAGNVVIRFDGRTAKSEKAIYLADPGTLQLIGENATIIDGPSTIVGSKITLYRNEDRIKVESSPKNRVTATIFPEESQND
jgi:lipopolysaccharide export system protein LptA